MQSQTVTGSSFLWFPKFSRPRGRDVYNYPEQKTGKMESTRLSFLGFPRRKISGQVGWWRKLSDSRELRNNAQAI